MVVLITNITDVPGPARTVRPTGVRVYTKRLRPGDSIRIDAKYVDEKMRKLESAGFISIGKVPPWYEDYKEKRSQRGITAEEAQSKIAAAKDLLARKAAAKKSNRHVPAEIKETKKAELKDTVLLSDDPLAALSKESKGKKRG